MHDNEEFRGEYRKYLMKKIIFIIIVLVILIVSACYSCTVSGRQMSLLDGWNAIINHILGVDLVPNSKEWWDELVVWDVTMPRVLGAIFCGSGLAVCGAVMQSLLKNPLAEPYTVGVSSGVVFGACLFLIMGISMTGVGQYATVFNAFIFGLIPIAVIILMTRFIKNLSPVTIILAGVALSYFFSGITTIMMVSADDETLSSAYSWQVGALTRITWDNIWIIAVLVVICMFVLLLFSKYLNAMSMGDNMAKALGIDINNVRTICLLVTTLLTASVLSFTGIIGFVGLIVPHIVRIFIGGDNNFVLPGSILLGSAVMIAADALSRFIMSVDIPVGCVMMMIGSPIFIYLVIGKRFRGQVF